MMRLLPILLLLLLSACNDSARDREFALDINGYVPADSSIVPIEPARFLETRPGVSTFDMQKAGIGRVGDRTVTEIEIAGRGNIPADAAAAPTSTMPRRRRSARATPLSANRSGA